MNYFSEFQIYPDKEIDNYSITFKKPRRPLKSLRDELRIALELKANNTSKPICALFSGGVDSQMLIITLRELGIPHVIVHLAPTYKGEVIAQQDIYQVEHFAKKHSFSVEIHKIDLELHRWVDQPAMNILRYQAPYIETHANIGLGGNNFHYAHNGLDYFQARSYIHNEAPYWLLQQSVYDFNTGFYQYTPELWFSFLFHEKAYMNQSFLKNNPHLPYDSSRLLKFNILYDEFGDELEYFQKRTGLEDFTEEVVAHDDRVWKNTGYDTWLTFTEKDLKSLYSQEVDSITRYSTVSQFALRTLYPPTDLLR